MFLKVCVLSVLCAPEKSVPSLMCNAPNKEFLLHFHINQIKNTSKTFLAPVLKSNWKTLNCLGDVRVINLASFLTIRLTVYLILEESYCHLC